MKKQEKSDVAKPLYVAVIAELRKKPTMTLVELGQQKGVQVAIKSLSALSAEARKLSALLKFHPDFVPRREGG